MLNHLPVCLRPFNWYLGSLVRVISDLGRLYECQHTEPETDETAWCESDGCESAIIVPEAIASGWQRDDELDRWLCPKHRAK